MTLAASSCPRRMRNLATFLNPRSAATFLMRPSGPEEAPGATGGRPEGRDDEAARSGLPESAEPSRFPLPL